MAFYHFSIILSTFIDFFAGFWSGIPCSSVSHFVGTSYLTFIGIQLTGCYVMRDLGMGYLGTDYKQCYICVYVCVCMYVCMRMCMCICMCLYMYVCIYVCIYIYIYIYISFLFNFYFTLMQLLCGYF